jgi:hypothetical protein
MSLVCFWLVLEDLFGNKKHVSTIVGNLIPNFPSVSGAIKDRINNGGSNGKKMEDHIKDTKKNRPSTGWVPMG